MGIELLQQGEDFLLIRSSGTGAIYAIRLQENRPKEPIVAGPVGSFLRHVPPRGETKPPATATATSRKRSPGSGVRPGYESDGTKQLRETVIGLLSEAPHPLGTREINEGLGRDPKDTNIYQHLKKWTERGYLVVQEEVNTDDRGVPRSRRVFQANEPSGPEASHLESSDHGSSNEGL